MLERSRQERVVETKRVPARTASLERRELPPSASSKAAILLLFASLGAAAEWLLVPWFLAYRYLPVADPWRQDVAVRLIEAKAGWLNGLLAMLVANGLSYALVLVVGFAIGIAVRSSPSGVALAFAGTMFAMEMLAMELWTPFAETRVKLTVLSYDFAVIPLALLGVSAGSRLRRLGRLRRHSRRRSRSAW